MPYRDNMEAAQAHIRTLSAELGAERARRGAAEAAQRAAEAARDELRLGGTVEQRSSCIAWTIVSGLAILGAAGVAYHTRSSSQLGQFLAKCEQAKQTASRLLRQKNEDLRGKLREKQTADQTANRLRRKNECLEARLAATRFSRVVLGRLEVRGSLDRNIIHRVISRHISKVKSCLQVKDLPGRKGRVVIQFVINAAGRVVSSEVQSSTLGNRQISSCVARMAKEWRFPTCKCGAIVIVSCPFVFEPLAPAGLIEHR